MVTIRFRRKARVAAVRQEYRTIFRLCWLNKFVTGLKNVLTGLKTYMLTGEKNAFQALTKVFQEETIALIPLAYSVRLKIACLPRNGLRAMFKT